MENVKDIAKWFLSKESMSHKKLQKLCYYSQAWYCALYDGTPLFEDEVQAWIHGPVIASLYPIYEEYRWNEIPQTDALHRFSDKTQAVLNAVWDTYGEMTGDQLETLTHSEAPWKEARTGLQPWETSTKAITTKSMRDFYANEYAKAQND
jgi:uncharacterized phage-associated protein